MSSVLAPITFAVMMLGAVGTMILALALIPIARRLGWLDIPDARKIHGMPTPLVGGVAIFCVFFALSAGWRSPVLPLFIASSVVLITGLVDDRWPLNAWMRFGAQALACGVMIFWPSILLEDFGRLFWGSTLGLGPLAIPITVFSALGVINAFNMIDGLDGLSGSVFLIAAGAVASIAALKGRPELFLILLSMACVAGFLLLNARWPWNEKARVFLGDSGSVLLGFWLAWMFITLGNDNLGESRIFAPMTAVWIFGLPLLDTTRLMRNRWKAGKSAFDADRSHLHHVFLAAGFTVGQAWWGIVLLSVAFAGVGVTLELAGVPEYLRFYGFVAVGFVYLHLVNKAWSEQRFLGRKIS